MIAGLVALGVFLAALSVQVRETSIGVYVGAPGTAPRRTRRPPASRPAIGGAVLGAVASGAIDPGTMVPLSIIGAVGGLLVNRAIRSTVRQRRSERLAQELPTVADTIALHVLAGESVATALRRFTEASAGVASEELKAAIDSGRPLDDALRTAAATSAHTEASRLYDLLGHAHRTGGGLADALSALASDYRAAMTRDLTAEGGRRALAAYGPILLLMVPVTLLFLMYPTLAGLNALSTTP